MKIFRKSQPKTLPAINLLELVVAVAFIAIIFTAGFRVFDISLRIVNRAKLSTVAELLAQDYLELAIAKRNEGWDQLVPGTYYFVEDLIMPENGFLFTPGTETIDIYTRSITIIEVERDGNDDIVVSGTIDPNTYYLEALVTWVVNGINEEVRIGQYVTNWNSF